MNASQQEMSACSKGSVQRGGMRDASERVWSSACALVNLEETIENKSQHSQRLSPIFGDNGKSIAGETLLVELSHNEHAARRRARSEQHFAARPLRLVSRQKERQPKRAQRNEHSVAFH